MGTVNLCKPPAILVYNHHSGNNVVAVTVVKNCTVHVFIHNRCSGAICYFAIAAASDSVHIQSRSCAVIHLRQIRPEHGTVGKGQGLTLSIKCVDFNIDII